MCYSFAMILANWTITKGPEREIERSSGFPQQRARWLNKCHQRYALSDPHIISPIGPCCRIDSGNSGNLKVRSLSKQTTASLSRSLRSHIGKKNRSTSPLSLLSKGLRDKEGPSRCRAENRKHQRVVSPSRPLLLPSLLYFFHGL